MTSSYRLLLSALALFLILFSCSSENKSSASANAPKPLTIVDKGMKSFPLDAETAVDFNSKFKVNAFDGREYLSFANRPLSRIYEFDYETGEPSRKIVLEKEGPNKVNLFFGIGIFFHTKDSIFVDSGGIGYYLINGGGEVLSRFGISKNNSMVLDCCPIFFGSESFVENSTVFGAQRYSISDEPEIFEYTFGSIDIIGDSKTKKLLRLSSFVPDYKEIIEMELAKDPWVGSFNIPFYRSGKLLYAASPISDTVHVFEDFNLVDKYFVGKSSIQLSDFRSFLLINQIQQIENGYQNVSQIDQPPRFGDIFISPDGQMIYRILIEGTRAKKVENSDQEYPEVAKASLIVLDKSSQQLTSLSLPVDELEIPLSTQSRSVFVSSAGIHFESKEQQSEDRLDFRVFGVKRVN